MALSIERLKLRILAGLSNPEYADREDLIQYAIDEALDIVGTKDLAEAFVYDIAYYRFVIMVDGPTEGDDKSYAIALKVIKDAPSISIDETTGTTVTTVQVAVRQRKSEY